MGVILIFYPKLFFNLQKTDILVTQIDSTALSFCAKAPTRCKKLLILKYTALTIHWITFRPGQNSLAKLTRPKPHSYLKSQLTGEQSFLLKQCCVQASCQFYYYIFTNYNHNKKTKKEFILNLYFAWIRHAGHHMEHRSLLGFQTFLSLILLVSFQRNNPLVGWDSPFSSHEGESPRWHNFIMDPCELF